MDIKEKIKMLPNAPGVYLMRDDRGGVLYVGKAKNLKKRVAIYFQSRRPLSVRLEAMVEKVKGITYIPASTDAEALLYENSLIKQLAPRYNVALRDDKSYPLLKLTSNEKFPRLFMTRRRQDDGAIYYGPYASAKLLREALGILRRLFPLRTCSKLKKDICLNYHIGQCLAPCAGKIDEARYDEIVSELKLFLDGRRSELLNLLSEKMARYSAQEDFEEAARLRDRLEALGSIKERSIEYGPLNEIGELKDILGLSHMPYAIEAFDVSNIMGEEAVGSMVYFYKGMPKKSEYRRFRIKTVCRIDDYGMMRELVQRRYKRLSDEKGRLPGLILIDGGKGHLGVAAQALKKLGLSEIPVIGIAKESERVYLKGRKEPLVLPKGSKALHLLERIRDEAHRFAISYHKKLLSKKVEFSELDNIRGIGDKRKRALMDYFGSIDRIRSSTLEELLKVKGMDERSARNIIEYFKK